MKPMSTTGPLSRAVRDFVVVGGGIAGCTVAYELARRGHSVTLYEQSSIAHAASGRNMGLLLYQVEVEVVKIMRQSLEIYREVEHGAPPFNLRQLPQLLLARDEEQMEVARAHAAALREIGVEAQPLDSQQVRSEVPQLSENIQGGYLLPGAWVLDPGPATQAFAQAATFADIGSNLCISHVLTLRTSNTVDDLDGAQRAGRGALHRAIHIQGIG